MRQSKEMPFGDIFISQLRVSKSPSIIPLAHDKFWEEYDRAEQRVIRNNANVSKSLSIAENQIQLELNKSKKYYDFVSKKKIREMNHRLIIILFLSPWIIGFLGFGIYPIVISFYYSLCQYDVLQIPMYVGLRITKIFFLRIYYS